MIVVDLQMPGMDGVEVLRHLAKLEFAGGVILLSAEDERVLHTAQKLASAHGLNVIAGFQKPVAPEALAAALLHPVLAVRHRPDVNPLGPEALRLGIARGDLVNVYQPKVNVQSGRVSGVESLVRWQHPTLGLLSPDRFIPIAEEHGLIDAVTHLVLRGALDQSRRWRDAGLDLSVAVNVSMDNLADLGFPKLVQGQARALGVRPGSLILEVTESRLMKDPVAALDILTRLKLMRFMLSIDDFGTGYSSLSQLRDLPFDEIKIDRGFVHGASREPTLRGIFDASCHLAHDLRMTIVAEGVEDAEDWELLRRSKCDQAQGYFIARPMPGPQIPDWIAAWRAP